MTTNNPTRFDEYSPQMGFYNEIRAFALEVSSAQDQTTDYKNSVWVDEQIMQALIQTDPRKLTYNEAEAEAIFTRAMDRLSQMMRQAVRARLMESGHTTAIDGREWNKPAERKRRAAAQR